MIEFDDKEALTVFIREHLMSTSEAIELLGITRQGLDYFVTKGKIVPVKVSSREKLYWRDDVEQLKKR